MTRFIVCRNCGRHTATSNVVARAYCTEECARVYSCCVNCGTYFPRGKGYDSEHCSKECAVTYRIHRRYGPEPVAVVADV